MSECHPCHCRCITNEHLHEDLLLFQKETKATLARIETKLDVLLKYHRASDLLLSLGEPELKPPGDSHAC